MKSAIAENPATLLRNAKEGAESLRGQRREGGPEGSSYAAAPLHAMAGLQNAMGNRALRRMLEPAGVQGKLSVDAGGGIGAKATLQGFTPQNALRRIPIGTLQQGLGNRKLARFFQGEDCRDQGKLKRKCACEGQGTAPAKQKGGRASVEAGIDNPAPIIGAREVAQDTATKISTSTESDPIQRISWDDVTSAVESGAEAVGSAVASGVEAVEQAGQQALGWLETEAGKLALSGANALASLYGGKVTEGPDGIIIDIPEIELLDSKTIPIIPSAGSVFLPILPAGFEVPPVTLVGALGVRLTAPSLTVTLGPGVIRNIQVRIDPSSSTYSASGQAYIGGAISEVADTSVALQGAAKVAIPSKPPTTLQGAVEGGFRLTVRGSVLGSLADTVKLAYSSGKLSLDQNFTMQLGPLLEADTDLYVDVTLEDIKVCQWNWPQDHWQVGKAEQYDLPLHVELGGDPPVTIGPVAAKPIPISDIETRLTSARPKVSGCKSAKEIWDELCKRGKLPPAACPGTTPGKPNVGPVTPPGPTPVGPVTPPVVPPPVTPSGGGGDCTKDINTTYNFEGKVLKWEVKVKDTKHTKMAARTHAQIEALATRKDAGECDSLPKECEKEFCNKVDSGDEVYGSQVTSETRGQRMYFALLKDALFEFDFRDSANTFDVPHAADNDVGFDIRRGQRMTRDYNVHGSALRKRGPNRFATVHLFPKKK